jgi:hypothetical protein
MKGGYRPQFFFKSDYILRATRFVCDLKFLSLFFRFPEYKDFNDLLGIYSFIFMIFSKIANKNVW